MSPRIEQPSTLSYLALLAKSCSSGNYSCDRAQGYAREAIIQYLSTLVVAGTIDPSAPLPEVIGDIPHSQTHRPVRLRSGLVTSISYRDSWIHLAERTPETDPVIVDYKGWALPLSVEYYGREIMSDAIHTTLKVPACPDEWKHQISPGLHKSLVGIRANDIVAFADEADA